MELNNSIELIRQFLKHKSEAGHSLDLVDAIDTLLIDHDRLRSKGQEYRGCIEYAVARCSRHGADAPAWLKVMHLFGTGPGFATSLCREFGVDPETLREEPSDVKRSIEEVYIAGSGDEGCSESVLPNEESHASGDVEAAREASRPDGEGDTGRSVQVIPDVSRDPLPLEPGMWYVKDGEKWYFAGTRYNQWKMFDVIAKDGMTPRMEYSSPHEDPEFYQYSMPFGIYMGQIIRTSNHAYRVVGAAGQDYVVERISDHCLTRWSHNVMLERLTDQYRRGL